MMPNASFAQVKKKFQNQKHKHQTVVVKENSEISDLDILDSEFNIEDFRVGETIRITTDDQTASKEVTTHNQIKKQHKRKVSSKSKKSKKFVGRSLNFSKKRTKRKKRSDYAFYPQPKKSKGKDYSNKCYRW